MTASLGHGSYLPRAVAAPLQPANGPALLTSPVALAALEDLGTATEARDAAVLQENLQRRLADRALVDSFAAAEFDCPAYRRFQIELIRYGLAVMRAWLYSGRAFALLNERRINLRPTAWELDRLQIDSDARGEIADFAIARALPDFEDRALRRGGWKATGGASLPTYFMGASLYQVPNPFRHWRRREQRLTPITLNGLAPAPVASAPFDPADRLAMRETLHRALARLDPSHREALQLSLDGYAHTEIAEILGLRSDRAVEGTLRRTRQRIAAFLDQEQEGAPGER